jgi:hypothetical protein
MLSWAKLKPPSEWEKACPILESIFTTIGSGYRAQEGSRRETPILIR